MKKNVFEMVVAMVNGQNVENMEYLREEINAEWARMTKKANTNRTIYENAKEIAFELMNGAEPMTVKELYVMGEDRWSEGFTPSKLQYAMIHYWNDAIIKHENGKSAFKYSLR